MRTIVISNESANLLRAHALDWGANVIGGRQLHDSSWEIDVDEDVAYHLDRLSDDPDRAIAMICLRWSGNA